MAPENEENVGTETEVTTSPTDDAGAETEKSATDLLKEGVARIEEKADEEIPPGEEKPEGGEITIPEGEEPPPDGEGGEAEEVDEAEALKRAGFTQKTLADLKTDLNKAMDQSQFWNWANANIDGFSDFIFQQMMASKGLTPKGKVSSITDLAGKPESQLSGESKLLNSGRYSQEQLDEFRELATEMGFVHRSEIEADKKAESAENAKKTATKTFDDFGKSETVKTQLTAMGLDWEKDAKAPIVQILLEDFGINDFGYVNSKNIARAFNTFVMEKEGGIEQLLANAKSEATRTHKEKLKLGKGAPETGSRGPSAPADVKKWLKTASADDIKKRMGDIAKRGR